MRRTLLALATVGLLLVGTACIPEGPPAVAPTVPPRQTDPPAPRTVKVYSSLALTGPARAQAQAIVNGIKLAFDESGGSGGTAARLGHLTVEYESLDDTTAARPAWDIAQETANAQRAAEDPRTMAYLGTLNAGATRIALPVLNRAGIPMVSPANTAGDLSTDPAFSAGGRKTFFRVIPHENAQGAVAARWAKDLGVTKVAVIDDGERYGKGLADAFEQAARTAGLTVVAREAAPKADSYTALVAKVRAAGADGLYYGGIVDNNAAVLLRNLRAVDPRMIFLGGEGVQDDEMIKGAGAAAEGMYATFIGLPPDRYLGAQAEWARRYRAKYGIEPQVYAIYGYEAAMVTLAAIREAGGDRAKMTDALRRVGTSFEGALGRWSFDQNGDTSHSTHTGVVVQQGKWIFSRVLS